MFSFFNRFFIRGLILVLPITLTIYIIVYGAIKAENIFAGIIKNYLHPGIYVPGSGILLTVIFIFLIGLLATNFLTRKIVYFFTSKFSKLPIVRAIYNPLKDFMSLFSSSSSSEMANKKVVIVNLEKLGIRCMGLVTREIFDDFDGDHFEKDNIVVYIPMSYMIGGFSVVVTRDQVKPINLPVDQALRTAITGWVKGHDEY